MHRIAFLAALLIAAPAFAEAPAMKPATPSPAPVQPVKATIPVVVDVNTATVDQIAELPGLTRGQAEAIVKGRPYKSIADLAGANVLPGATLEMIKDRLTIGK